MQDHGARHLPTMLLLLAAVAACSDSRLEQEQGPPTSQHVQTESSSWSGSRVNIVLILTDDQRWDTLDSMPYLAQLANEGVRFDNAMVTTPACNPVRASLLSGGVHAAQAGILENRGSNSDLQRFRGDTSLGVTLQKSGYITGFVGKYLNNFQAATRRRLAPDGRTLKRHETHVPPGWTSFWGTSTRENKIENPWHRFPLNEGSSGETWGVGRSEWIEGHIEEKQREWALGFLEGQSAREPFFLMLSTHAPHAPAVPEAPDADLFSDFVYRDRAYAEADIEDKPTWVHDAAVVWDEESVNRDSFPRSQLRSLRSVDRLVRAVVQQLEESGLASNTLLLVTSDNGMLWGEHRTFGKNKAFEESIRVPLVAWRPGISVARVPHLIAANLDVPATIMDLAGVDNPATSGVSLGPFLDGITPRDWRTEVVIESYSEPAWLGVRRMAVDEDGTIVDSHKYIEYYDGSKELYDLGSDPLEKRSRHEDTRMEDVRNSLSASLPIARGPVIFGPSEATPGIVGTEWSLVPRACCDEQPMDWDIYGGNLPPGLELDGADGRIHGVPTKAGSYKFSLRVRTDRVAAPGRPGFFVHDYAVTIAEPGLEDDGGQPR